MSRRVRLSAASPWAVAGFIVAVCVLVAAAWVALVGAVVLAPGVCPSPPSQEVLRDQQEFVVLHLPDASDFELGHRDCDDSNAGYVEFTTSLAPEAARKAFLVDERCELQADPGGAGVLCTSGRFDVYLTFDAGHDGSVGTLDINPR